MTDTPGSTRTTPRQTDLEIERRILRARTAAMDALEQGNWDAVVLACGKVLQEVARNELPYNEHGGTLPQLLERLARSLQTDQPVSDLAASLKDAGGLRGFFDLESDVDEELARATVSVIEAFLTYTYAFREEVKRLAELAAARRAGAAGATPGQPDAVRAATDAPTPRPPATPQPSADPRSSERRDAARQQDRGNDERRVGAPAPRGADRDAPAGGATVRDATVRDATVPDTSARDDGGRDDGGRDERDRSAESAGRDDEHNRDRRTQSAFDRFDERNDDPIRQTWKPPRSKE